MMTQLLMRAFLHLRYREEGQTLVEYALILVFVSVAAVTLLSTLGGFPAVGLQPTSTPTSSRDEGPDRPSLTAEATLTLGHYQLS